MLRYAIALAALCVVAASAAAQNAPPYAKRNCEAEHLSRDAFTRCYADNFAQADRALAQAYREALNHPGNDHDAVRDVERAWIAYKDKECAIENRGDATWKKNPDYGLRHLQCEIEKTEQRIEELQLLTCEGASLCYPHVY